MAVNVFVTEPMSKRVSASTGAGLHVAQPISLRQCNLSVGDDRHRNAGDPVLIEVGLKNLLDAVGQRGRRRQVGQTKVGRGHEQVRMERLGLRPRPSSRAEPAERPSGLGWFGALIDLNA